MDEFVQWQNPLHPGVLQFLICKSCDILKPGAYLSSNSQNQTKFSPLVAHPRYTYKTKSLHHKAGRRHNCGTVDV